MCVFFASRWFWAFCSCALLIQSAGCGGPAGPKRVYSDVTGRVTFKGEPLKMGKVMFQPSSGPFASGDIEADGTYSLEAEIGPNTVMIVSSDPESPVSGDPSVRKNAPPPKSHIPEEYGTLNSGLEFEVEAGPNEANFDLK